MVDAITGGSMTIQVISWHRVAALVNNWLQHQKQLCGKLYLQSIFIKSDGR